MENNTWARVNMEFLFELNTRREIAHLHVLLCLLYKQDSLLLRIKADFIYE